MVVVLFLFTSLPESTGTFEGEQIHFDKKKKRSDKVVTKAISRWC